MLVLRLGLVFGSEFMVRFRVGVGLGFGLLGLGVGLGLI